MPKKQSYPKNSDDFTVEADKLLAELLKIDNANDEKNSVMGDLRSTIKSVLDASGYHKTALATIRTINDMPATKKADFLRTFEPMFEAMSPTWRKQCQDMLDKAKADTADMEGDMS